jgi:carboxyl-terminal processing protease
MKHWKPFKKQTVAKFLLAACLPLTMTGCGSSADVLGLTKLLVKDDVQALYDYMIDWYYWYEELPIARDLTRYDTAEEALAALRFSSDKFSNITSAVSSNALLTQGRATAFGITYKVENDETLIVRLVQPNSPAKAQGVLRGDVITAIDGVAVKTLITEKRLEDSFGESTVGVTKKFSITRAAIPLEVTLTKTDFVLNSAPVATVHPITGGKAGYIVYNQFTEPSLAQWRSAVQSVKDQGATKIIVDLRFNGGGRVATATDIAAALLPASAQGKKFATLEFNKKRKSNNSEEFLRADSLAGSFTDVVFLSSPSSCSAAELVMNGVTPFLTANQVTNIGQTTCGKPYGFTPQEFKGKLFNIATFVIKNANGSGDYFDGIKPKCGALDDNKGPLGDATESMLASALAYLNSGICAPVASSQIQGKSADGKIRLKNEKDDYWQLPSNGLARELGFI